MLLAVAATPAVFEIPFPPCNTFQGREVLLNRMETFFHASPAPMSGQLTFAICGLGTSTAEVLSPSPVLRHLTVLCRANQQT